MNEKQLKEIARGYRKFEKEMDEAMEEMERIDTIIDSREDEIGEFNLSRRFDPQMTMEEEKEITKRCDALEDELANRGFIVQLDENAPLKVLDLYLQHVALITEGLQMPGKWNSNFQGCKYWCEDCFQREWCSVREEIEEEADKYPCDRKD